MTIQAEKLSFTYRNIQHRSSSSVLDNVSFGISSDECVALIGSSGAGKSTLAQMLIGLLKPDAGKILLDGSELKYSDTSLRELRRRVGLIFQFPEAQIFESTVYLEVAFALKQLGLNKSAIQEKVESALHTVGLIPSKYLGLDPLKLSGGEARLVSIASLIVINPDYLILDEPTLGLDIAHRQRVIDIILDRKAQSKAVLLISHDLDLVLKVCPRTIILQAGRIKHDGSTYNLLNSDELLDLFGMRAPEITSIMGLFRSSFEGFDDHNISDSHSLIRWIRSCTPEKKSKICSVLLQQCNTN